MSFIISTLKSLLKIKALSLGLLFVILQLFIFVNQEAIFGEDLKVLGSTIMLYMIMGAYVYALTDVKAKIFNVSFLAEIPMLFISFMFTVGVLTLFSRWLFNPVFSTIQSLSFGFQVAILIHVLFVSFIEEQVFRQLLPQYIGDIWSNVLFALFHYVVYGGLIFPMVVAFLLGMALAFIRNLFSPETGTANMGVHAAYNSVVLGLFRLASGVSI